MKKILVVKTSSLGDIIHCFQAVSELRKLNPGAKIHWLVNKPFCEIVSLHPALDKVIPFDRRSLSKFSSCLPEFLNLRNLLQAEKYDLALDFQGLLRNSFFAWVSGAKKVAGFHSPAERVSRIFYDAAVKTDKYIHAVERNCALADGIFGQELSLPAFEAKKDAETVESVKSLLRNQKVDYDNDCYMVLAPCARWRSKNWPPSFFISVLKKIGRYFPDLPVILIGSAQDRKICDEIIQGAQTESLNLAGKTNLRQLFEIIRKAGIVFCVDSGPMHIAAALSVPVCALFGPTDPEKTGPYGKGNKVFQSGTCIKCLRRYCFRSSETCHSAVSPDEVSEYLKINIEVKK